MSDIKNIFNIGQSALQAFKTGIEVTAQNIANVDTPGYTKKEVVFGNEQVSQGSPLFFHGVQVSEVKRIYNEELSNQIVNQETNSGYWEIKKEFLGVIEEVFNESDEQGLNKDLSQFWNAWQGLSINPNGYQERQEVASSAEQLSGSFKSANDSFQEIMKNIREEMNKVLEEMNAILAKIAEFNQKTSETINGKTNEYQDQINQLVENLGQFVNVNQWKEKNGQTNVSINGHPLVEGNEAFSLMVEVDEDGQLVLQKKISYPDDSSDSSNNGLINITDRISGGKIKGLLEIHNEFVPDSMEKLDNLAYTLNQMVNEQHQKGYGLDGSTNTNFFTFLDSKSGAAGNLALNPEIKDNVSLIAASSSPEIKNNENVLSMVDLQHKFTIQDGNMQFQFHEYYANLVGSIGKASKGAQDNGDHQQLILNNLKDKRSAISEVSLDEELANLIKFQQTYNASAKLISTADEMFSTIINMKA